jgi:translation initiation factor 2-alpha kinase 4
MLHLERKKEKELEKRERLHSNCSPSRPKRAFSKTNSESDEKINSLDNPFSKATAAAAAAQRHFTHQQKTFQPFEIEFLEPHRYHINCNKLVSFNEKQLVTVYRGVDVNTNEIYSVHEWRYLLEKNKIYEENKLAICQAEMHKFEEEFKKILKLNNKLLLRQYHAFKYYKEPGKNLFVVQICMEYMEGIRADLFLMRRKQSFLLAPSDSALRTFGGQLLAALELLHAKSLPHRDLKAACVYIENDGIGTGVKLSDYGLFKKLSNLGEIVNNDAAAVNLVQGSCRSDLHQLGLLLLCLSLGELVDEYHPRVPSSLSPDLRSFISICLRQEKVDCKYLLKHPFILKADLDSGSMLMTNTAAGCNTKQQQQRNAAKRSLSNHFDEEGNDLLTFTDYPSQSRLNTEFEVIGVIGHGAFGQVLKVKNKLDMRFYAIKRIRINPTSKHNRQITREIKLLSRLNHENVVRYYSTWVEKYEEVIDSSNKKKISSQLKTTEQKRRISQNADKSDSSEDFPNLIRFQAVVSTNNDHHKTTSSISETSSDDESNPGCITWSRKERPNDNKHRLSSLTDSSTSQLESFISDDSANSSQEATSNDEEEETKKPSSSPFIKEKKSKKMKNEDTDESVIFAETSGDQLLNETKNLKKQSKVKKQLKSMSENVIATDDDDDNDGENDEIQLDRQFIYIQMEFCGGKTLKDLIEKGLYEKEDTVWCLFREILQGLNHIHEQGMIHRDLKPGNVLIDASGHAKIGDFGLATTKLFIQTELHHQASKSLTTETAAAAATTAAAAANGLPLLLLQQQANRNNSSSNLTFQSGGAAAAAATGQGQDSRQLDSTSLSGAVGTALYVAPELLVPTTRNKFVYTQKVDIYSLGIMFYEMNFAFSTNMERIHVIQNLRNRDIILSASTFTSEYELKYEKQLTVIKSMLNHDPNVRPSAKELLLCELIPRKADEIALDEMLQYSFNNKQSTNYKKILKALFEQKNTKIEDASFDSTNCKPPTDFKLLQIRENLFSTFMSIFQKNGAYMIQYPLLTPYDHHFDDYSKAFKLIDASGLVVSLPYNHRIPFARYLARSGCTNIKRYYIGKAFSEKLKLTSLHPREHTEASYDIVTSSQGDFLPEVEILSIVNSVISSFGELKETSQTYRLVINNTLILNAILLYCGISDECQQSRVYHLLSEYNSKLIKSQDVSKENRIKWFKDHLPLLDLSEATCEKLLNFLLKSGEYDKIAAELRSLTKSETHFAKLAKQGLYQLKLITTFYKLIGLKFPIYFATSFVLPAVAHSYEYSGFMFQLIIKKKKKTDEYDILANGGRYDKLINFFRNKQLAPQFAVGVSFDFEKLVFLINEKTKQPVYRTELAICSIGSSNEETTQFNSMHGNGNKQQASASNNRAIKQNGILMLNANSGNSLHLEELKNRLRLSRQFEMVNKFYNISTNVLYEKFMNMDEIDEYCKKHSISSYAYIKTSSAAYSSQIFTTFDNSNSTLNGPASSSSSSSYCSTLDTARSITNDTTSSANNNSSSSSSNNSNYSFIKIKSMVEKSSKYLEKKFNLSEFLSNTNLVINNLTSSFNSINFNPTTQNALFNNNNNNNMSNTTPILQQSSLSPAVNAGSGAAAAAGGGGNSSSSSVGTNLNSLNFNNQSNFISYLDFIDSRLNSVNSSNDRISTPISNGLQNLSGAGNSQNTMNSNSSTFLNNITNQLNITLLLEPSSSSSSSSSKQQQQQQQQSVASSTRKKLESQVVSKIGHVFGLFNARIRIELIVIETPDMVLQALANGLHLEMDEQHFNSNWVQCLDKLNNVKYKRQLGNFKLDEIIRELRYAKKSKVFILFSLKSEQFKLLVAP